MINATINGRVWTGGCRSLGNKAVRRHSCLLAAVLVVLVTTSMASAATTNGVNSTVVAANGTAPADGTTTDTITVTLRDDGNNPVSGHTVALTAPGALNVSISAPSGASNAGGVVTFTVRSTTAQTATFVAKDVTDDVTVVTGDDVVFTAGNTSASRSFVDTSSGVVVANGTTTATITVRLKDANNNPVPGNTVTLDDGAATNITISAASGASDASGAVTFTVKSTTAQQAIFTATDTTDGVTISDTATVNFIAGTTDAGTSTVVATDGTAIADGVDTDTVTVTLRDANSNPVANNLVILSAGAATNVTITSTPASGLSNVSGVVTFTVKSTDNQTATFTATDNTDGIPITQTDDVIFTIGPVSAARSTVQATAGTAVADGVATDTITVTLLDGGDNPIVGHDVSLDEGTATNVTISAPSGQSDASGVVTFTVSSTDSQAATFTATDTTAAVAITDTAIVTFVAGTTDAAQSTVVAVPASLAGDGTETSTVTVTLLDANDNPVVGNTVSLSSGAATGMTITPASGTSNASGQVAFAVKSTDVQVATLTAQDTTDAVTITQTAAVTFTVGTTSAADSTAAAVPDSVTANGVAASTVTVTLLDAGDNPIPGHTVTLSEGAASDVTIGAASGPSSAGGQVTFLVTSTAAQTALFTATDTTDGIQITQKASVVFSAGPADAGESTVVAGDGNAIADGNDFDSVTVTINDADGNPVSGHFVTLAAGAATNVTINPDMASTSASGVAIFFVRSTDVQTATFTATDTTASLVITQTAEVAFTAGPTSAAESTVEAATATAVADGVDTDIIIVTLRDANGHPVSGHTVALSDGAALNVTTGPASGPSSAQGVVTFNVASTTAQTATFRATDTTIGVPIVDAAQVAFTAGPADADESSVTANRTTVFADGVANATITVRLSDAGGNAIAGHDVTLSAGAATNVIIDPTSDETDGSGLARFTVRSTDPQTAVFTATDVTGGVTIDQTATVTFSDNEASVGEDGTGAIENDEVAATVGGLPAGTLLNLENDASGGTTLTIGELDDPQIAVRVSGFPAGVELDAAFDTAGDPTLVLTQPGGATTTIALKSLPDGANVGVTLTPEGELVITVTDPAGATLGVTVSTAGAGDGSTFTVTYNPDPTGNATRIVSGFPGLKDSESLGGSVTISASGLDAGSVVTVGLEYLDSDLVGIDEQQLRLMRLNDMAGNYEPAGTNDVGVASPTGAAGDYGVQVEENSAWAEVTSLSTFAVGIPDDSETPDDGGDGCGVGCGPLGLMNVLLMLFGMQLMRRRIRCQV